MVIHKSVSVKSIHFIRERDPNSLKQTNKIISLIDYREKHEFEKEIGNRSIHRNGKNFVCKKKRLKKNNRSKEYWKSSEICTSFVRSLSNQARFLFKSCLETRVFRVVERILFARGAAKIL